MAAAPEADHADARPAHTMSLWQEALVYLIAVLVVVAWLTVKAADEEDIWPSGGVA
jgi:hypothetical protein